VQPNDEYFQRYSLIPFRHNREIAANHEEMKVVEKIEE